MSPAAKLKKLKSKIIITGEPGAGKSFITQATDACVASQEIGVSIGKVSETIEDTSHDMTLLTWAITRGRPKESTHLDHAHAAIIVCDLTKPETVNETTKWAKRILTFTGDIPLFFAGNNAESCNSETYREFRKVANEYNSAFFPIYGKDRESARNLLGIIAHEISENMTKNEEDPLISW
jgi:signal recognition particle receptor subunit beta